MSPIISSVTIGIQLGRIDYRRCKRVDLGIPMEAHVCGSYVPGGYPYFGCPACITMSKAPTIPLGQRLREVRAQH